MSNHPAVNQRDWPLAYKCYSVVNRRILAVEKFLLPRVRSTNINIPNKLKLISFRALDATRAHNVHRPNFRRPVLSQKCELVHRKHYAHLLAQGADTMTRLTAVAAAAAVVVGFSSIPSPADAHITTVYPLSRAESYGPRYKEW